MKCIGSRFGSRREKAPNFRTELRKLPWFIVSNQGWGHTKIGHPGSLCSLRDLNIGEMESSCYFLILLYILVIHGTVLQVSIVY